MVKAEDDIQFNTDIMDVQDKQNIDVSQFSRRGYIMPGDYNFIIRVNQNALEEQPGNDSNLLIVFYVQIMPDDFVMQLHRF